MNEDEKKIIVEKILGHLNGSGKITINVEKSENGRVFIRSKSEECLLASKNKI